MRIFLASVAVAGCVAAAAALTVISPPEPDAALTTGTVQESFALAESDVSPTELTFDLLRMENDGSLLVAGRAAPRSEVEIVAGDETLGTIRAGDSGEFVYTHSAPPRSYELRLRSGTTISKQVALIEPALGDEGALAIVATPSGPTRVSRKAGVELPVAIEAVDVENGEVLVAGTTKAAGAVRVYVDDAFVGETEAKDGRYLLRAAKVIAEGRHSIRVDVVAADGQVAARSQVPLIHQAGPDEMLNDDPTALRTGASVIIRRGDSLWRISRRAYGQGTRYTTIFEANRAQIADPDRIFAGQVFKLPAATDG